MEIGQHLHQRAGLQVGPDQKRRLQHDAQMAQRGHAAGVAVVAAQAR